MVKCFFIVLACILSLPATALPSNLNERCQAECETVYALEQSQISMKCQDILLQARAQMEASCHLVSQGLYPMAGRMIENVLHFMKSADYGGCGDQKKLQESIASMKEFFDWIMGSYT